MLMDSSIVSSVQIMCFRQRSAIAPNNFNMKNLKLHGVSFLYNIKGLVAIYIPKNVDITDFI